MQMHSRLSLPVALPLCGVYAACETSGQTNARPGVWFALEYGLRMRFVPPRYLFYRECVVTLRRAFSVVYV